MNIKEIAEGKYNIVEVIDFLQGKNSDTITKFLDDMVGEACLLSIGISGTPQDRDKAKRLFEVIELVSGELLPNYKSRQGYQNSQASGGGSQPKDFPQEEKPKDRLPEELASEKAMGYWQKAVEVGLVDEDLNLKKSLDTKDGKTEITRYIIANFCHTFSTKLKLKYKYSYFKKLWSIKNLAQDRNKASELGYYTADDVISMIFDK